MNGLRSVATIALWRSSSGRGMLALIGLGIFVAATLLAAAPIYAWAMADLGLTFAIHDDLQGRNATSVEFAHVPLRTAEGDSLRATVERRIDERLGWFREGQSRYTRLGWFPVYHAGEETHTDAPLGQLQSVTGYETHVRVDEGRLPGPGTPGGPIEVAMSAQAAKTAGIEVGETFDLRESFDNCARQIQTEPFPPPPPPCDIATTVGFTHQATLVGIIEPLDPDDPFWVHAASDYFEPRVVWIDDAGPVVPMLADERAIYDGFASRYPGYLADMQWHVFANVDVLNRGNFERARDDLVGLYREFESYRVYAFSPLKDTLDSFGETADYQQTPLIILLLQITGIALFYVGLVAAIVVERQSQEIALLRSRGATLAQIAGIYATQGLFLGIPALFLAPFIAAAATAFLGLTPAFSNVSNGDLLPVTILPVSFALAAAGVLLALLALLAPVVAVAMRGSLALRRAESRPGRSFIQRYYLDLALAAAAILLLVELRERDTVFEPSATGGVSSDPLLLASPALAIAAASAIILRLNPLLLRVFARVARAAAAPAMALGLWQLVRNSGQYTRLALLLMMAVAVGTFAASYTTTTEKSYRDRANYQAGADFRAFSATGRAPSLSTAEFNRRVAELPGVESGTVIVRTTAGFATPGTTSQGFQLLGIDADTAGPMLWYRDDFAGPPLPEVLRDVDPSPLRKGLPLPDGATELSAWVRAADSLEGVNIRAGIRDSTGRYLRIDLGELQAGSEWQHLSAPLKAEFQAPFQPPLELISLTFSEPTNRAGERVLYIDDIEALDAAGNATPVETFEAQAPWTVMPDRASTHDEFVGTPDGAHSGTTGARYTFRQGVSTGLRGVYFNNFMTPLPAVVSRSFLDTTGLSVGATALLQVDVDTLVPIVIRGSFNLLPTSVSEEGPVVVVDRDSLVRWAAIVSPFATEEIDANEAWFDLAPGADEAALEQALRDDPFGLGRTVSRARELQRANDNPLIAAGGSGILAIAFVAVLGLVAIALITQLLASVTRRRVELAVVRALGLSRGQVLRMLTLEYGVVILLGVAAGVVLGLFVSGQMLSFLDVTEAGTRFEPPFQLQTRWLVVIGAAALVAASCAAALIAVARQLAGPNEARALRTE